MRVSKVNSNETGADKKVGSILNLLLREGGVPAGGGGRVNTQAIATDF